jgi:hypothetical protein
VPHGVQTSPTKCGKNIVVAFWANNRRSRAAGSGASLVLVEGVHFAESERFQDGAARVSFAIGDLIEKAAINAMSFGESHLISLLLNRDSQQLKNFAVIKYTCVTA